MSTQSSSYQLSDASRIPDGLDLYRPIRLEEIPNKCTNTHGHRMEDCRQLREEVARLFNNGHLRGFLSDRAKNHFKNKDSNKQNEQDEPRHVIHMIIGGVDVFQGPMFKRTKVSIKREKGTRDYMPEGTLFFNDEDAEGITQPHNDALVISVLMNKTRVKRLLIDPGSSANTGEITLPVNITGTTQETKFYVIKGDMRYNALFGRLWIHNMKVVPSTLHQVLKFPTPEGTKTVYGEQPAIKEMFVVDEVIPISTLSSTKESGSKAKQEAK
ncbi:PREDICTED: uncharacterized protein LOC109232726 [Nicotiana attenuata]|uniref:uncharacterized protein LOC109232726 n=1 Tax=Nicotiana attenuata TaxID=49451 RepID=UPI0009052AE8|nr:PREDICTED: uncharacterized protein LOC109232726 [Nicotiana attenuata]